MTMKPIGMQPSIDLNCDLGEYDELTQRTNDAAIMALISSCNIACGGHAGNQQVIDHTVALAITNQVNIGAHPSYPDKVNFGRQVMHLPAKELQAMLCDQIAAIQTSAQSQGSCMSHVKPHGALYNQAAVDLDLAMVLMAAVAEIDSGLMFYGLAHSKMEQAAQQFDIQFIAEGFADRAYTGARTLVPRAESGAVITDVTVMLKQVIQMLEERRIVADTGEVMSLHIDTLCLHGDHLNAMQTVQFISQGLLQAGFLIQAPQTRNQHV